MANTPNTARAPKGYARFKELLPRDGFVRLDADAFKEMISIINKEPDKKQQQIYFTQILDKLFAGGWGWYMRLGRSLSEMSTIQFASQLPEKDRSNGLKVLRMVKDTHIKLNYKPSYIQVINHFIRDFGGQTLSREQVRAQQKEKFDKAATALRAGAKMPRKLKKAIKTNIEKAR